MRGTSKATGCLKPPLEHSMVKTDADLTIESRHMRAASAVSDMKYVVNGGPQANGRYYSHF